MIALGLLVLAAGCGSDSTETTSTSASSAATTTTTTTIPTSTSTTTTTTLKAAGEADVDLRFTGTLVINVKGKTGRCTGTADSFGFEVTNADYQGVGQSLSISKSGTSPGDITYLFDANRAWDRSANATLTFSSDLKTVQIDDELAPVLRGGVSPGPLHLSGSITCP